jgi:hypothetical protein
VTLSSGACEPEDYKPVRLVYSSLQAMAKTLGVPYSSEQGWREGLSRQRDDNFAVVACVQGEVVGYLALSLHEPEDSTRGTLWDSCTGWLARKGRQHRVDGGLPQPRRQLVESYEV